jgi:excisionase family DNA binding protein
VLEEKALRSAALAALLRHQVFDLEDAAEYLGVEPETLSMQVYRGRIASVRYGGHRYFGLGDLNDYRDARRRGKASEITPRRGISIPRFGGMR